MDFMDSILTDQHVAINVNYLAKYWIKKLSTKGFVVGRG